MEPLASRSIEIASSLAVEPEQLWAVISTMAGVNAELAPWLHMSVPAAVRGKTLADMPLGETAFVSWLLALGLVPFDRHRLCLWSVVPGRSFVEHSSSWLQRVWQHERTLEPIAGGTRICDRVDFEPRVAVLAPIVERVVTRLFRHRHARLRARYGQVSDVWF